MSALAEVDRRTVQHARDALDDARGQWAIVRRKLGRSRCFNGDGELLTGATGESPATSQSAELHPGAGVWQATALNVANMVGSVHSLRSRILAAMHGPQALVAWVIRPFLSCVTVSCGASWGRPCREAEVVSFSDRDLRPHAVRSDRAFLFIWQFLVSGTLELASGYIGAVDYLAYPFRIWTNLTRLGPAGRNALAGGDGRAAGGPCLLPAHPFAGGLGCVVPWNANHGADCDHCRYVHFDSAACAIPADAFARPETRLLRWMGGAMTIAIYDYLGYYNICHLATNLDRADDSAGRHCCRSSWSAALYLAMNLAIIGVVPWERAMQSKFVASEFMEICSVAGAELFTADPLDGRRLRLLHDARLLADFLCRRTQRHFLPGICDRSSGASLSIASLVWLGALTAVFAIYRLQEVIDAAVCRSHSRAVHRADRRLHLLRTTRPGRAVAIRMWLYPLPSLGRLPGGSSCSQRPSATCCGLPMGCWDPAAPLMRRGTRWRGLNRAFTICIGRMARAIRRFAASCAVRCGDLLGTGDGHPQHGVRSRFEANESRAVPSSASAT